MIADYFATVLAVEGEDAVDGEDESDQDDTEMVSESRRDVKASNVDSEENCDIESSGGYADDSEDSISDDEGLADNSVSQIETDIQDNMMNEWMNENLYIARKKLPHKTLRVHSARYTQCIHVSSRKRKLPKDMHSYPPTPFQKWNYA